MEPYPPTLDVRFNKDHILEMVKDKYQLNAYLLGKIFSVTKQPGDVEESDSESSSEENLSLFDSSDEESSDEAQKDSFQKQKEASIKAKEAKDNSSNYNKVYPFQKNIHQLNKSVTRGALAKENSELNTIKDETQEELSAEKRELKISKLEEYEKSLDMDMIKDNQELNEVYQYYQVILHYLWDFSHEYRI